MHPRQAKLLSQASELINVIAAKKNSAPKAAVLWKYTDPEGNVFYLDEKKTSIKSPFSGKSFTAKPEKHTPSQVGQDLKEEIKKSKQASDSWDL